MIATVSASALALHLDCSRTYIGKLEDEGVIQQQGGDGSPFDQSRVAYLRYVRRERRQSPHGEADAAHVAVKTEMAPLQLAEKRHEMVRRDAHDAMIDQMAGLVYEARRLACGSLARTLSCDGEAEAVLRELRTEIADTSRRWTSDA